MKRLKKILIGLLVLVGILVFAALLFLNTLTPTYEGELELSGITNNVEVYFDTYGIPHIYADNEMEATKALGYVHAQDRLWQMELFRRAGSGRLSEVFGDKAVETDKFFLSLGIDDYNEENLAKLDKNDPAMVLARAYLDGINQFIESGPTPVEFYLTGLTKQKFEIKDIFNAVSYMGFTFNKGTRDIVNTNFVNRLDASYTAELFEEDLSKVLKIPNHKDSTTLILKELDDQITSALNNLPIPELYGSNSWVLSPKKTATGKVLFENDPHISQAQPSVWYEAHLVTPDYEKYGYYLAGVPFPLLSHDRNMAHGLTMLANDDTNFYFEEQHPTDSTLYRYKDGWEKYEYVTKSIKVKGTDPVEFQFKKTHRGPIVNANHANRTRVEGEKEVSMWWLFTHFDNRLVHSLYQINHSKTLEEFKTALPQMHAPGLNVMYGDAQGNVAWFGTAKLYRMPEGTSTKFILDGASGEDDPIEFLDFQDNPQSINPPWNYVYSANNQPDSTCNMYVPGYFASSKYRAGRIVDMLEGKKEGWTKQDMANMAFDIELRTGVEQLTELLAELTIDKLTDEQVNFVEELMSWDGRFGLKSRAGVFFEKMREQLHYHLFADEFESVEEYHSYMVQLKLDKVFGNASSKWWDDVSTSGIMETKTDIINAAFSSTWQQLTKELGADTHKWTWDRVHFLEHDHPIGSNVSALRKYFNVGPFSVAGTDETLNNQGYRVLEDGTYKVTSIPSTRRVIDFSDIENSISILPTGQSGNPLSKHYKDQAEMYNKGEFRKMLMNEEEIKGTTKDVLRFKPKVQ